MFGNILGKVKLPGGVTIGANFPIGTDPSKGKKQPGVGGEDSTPQNGINRMMANVKRGGLFSRPYLYYVFITPPKTLMGVDVGDIRGVQLNCSACSIPGFTMATKEARLGRKEKSRGFNGKTKGLAKSDGTAKRKDIQTHIQKRT